MKTQNTKILVIILIIIFFIGLYATMYFNNPYKSTENMTNVTSRCPNMLVKKGNVLFAIQFQSANQQDKSHAFF